MRPKRLCKALATRREAVAVILSAVGESCSSSRPANRPIVEFTRVPQADANGSASNDIIEGTVKGARPGQRIVLYARGAKWWVQPLADQPFTNIRPSSRWTNATHLGTEYAALLAESSYRPIAIRDSLPEPGGEVAAVAIVKGSPKPPSRIISFSGYEWRVRDAISGRGGNNRYDPANVWTDQQGALHLKIARSKEDWTCAEVSLTRSLGYGTYNFVVRDTGNLEPAAAFSMFTYDYAGGTVQNRELDIEISRWGDPASKNSQFVVQPFYIPANVRRFQSPGGKLVHSFRWEEGHVFFRSVLLSSKGSPARTVAEQEFTSGVPAPGIESARMNLYVFRSASTPLRSEAEVVVEQFSYIP